VAVVVLAGLPGDKHSLLMRPQVAVTWQLLCIVLQVNGICHSHRHSRGTVTLKLITVTVEQAEVAHSGVKIC